MISLTARDRLLLNSQIDSNGCWLWQGVRFSRTGYGQITYNGKTVSTHRLSLHIFCSFDLESEKLVLHHCDVKNCINPDHLYIGTHQNNADDSVKRGRQLRGEKHPEAKLTENNVREIRALIKSGIRYADIAMRFKVDPSLIGMIKRRRIWTHVKE